MRKTTVSYGYSLFTDGDRPYRGPLRLNSSFNRTEGDGSGQLWLHIEGPKSQYELASKSFYYNLTTRQDLVGLRDMLTEVLNEWEEPLRGPEDIV